jgi:hypothetical protein
MPLELGSLRKAVAALSGVLEKCDDEALMGRLDEVTRNAVKSGAIQHFEFTYELCWKFIKRWLETNISPSAADGVARRELFRLAAENRLVLDVEAARVGAIQRTRGVHRRSTPGGRRRDRVGFRHAGPV